MLCACCKLHAFSQGNGLQIPGIYLALQVVEFARVPMPGDVSGGFCQVMLKALHILALA